MVVGLVFGKIGGVGRTSKGDPSQISTVFATKRLDSGKNPKGVIHWDFKV